MSAEAVARGDADRKKNRFHFDRHTPDYRHQFEAITTQMQAMRPLAWSDTHGGHWVAAGNRELFKASAGTSRSSRAKRGSPGRGR